MNKIFTIGLFAVGGLLILIPAACTNNSSISVQMTPTPVIMPTPTAVVTSATVNATNTSTFSPASVTISHGGAVTFINVSGVTHTLVIDNGSGTCAQNYTTWPQTITFPTAGTFSYHCTIHSSCGTAVCSGCAGMIGQVIVQ